MTTDEIKQKIIEICKKINAPIPVIMAIAGIESNFNPSSKSKSGTIQDIGANQHCMAGMYNWLWKL